MIASSEKSSQLTIVATVICFGIIGFGALYVATDKTLTLISDIIHLPIEISFNKGSLYLWGVAFILLLFVAGIIYKSFSKKDISTKLNKRLTQLVIVLLVFTFILPQITHFATDSYLNRKGYVICKSQSKQWLHVQTIVYSKSNSCAR